jgi:DNA-binding transcriptional LysR family regulator
MQTTLARRPTRFSRATTMKPSFDSEDLTLFLSLAQHGMLAHAAADAAIHHSTAFRRLGELEERIGVRLFNRNAGSYSLTAAGERILPFATRLRKQHLAFENGLLNLDKSLSGKVRATTSDGLASHYLGAHLARFRRQYPEIEVELVVDNQMLDLSERVVDVAIRPTRKLEGQMVGRKAADMAYSLYASKEYLGSHPRIDPAAPVFEGHEVIGYAAAVDYFSTAKWLSRHARAAKVVARSNQFGPMLGMAQAGMGIAALPCAVGDATPGLTRLIPPPESMTTHLWLCTHPHIRAVARIRALLDFLHASISADQGRLRGEV